MIKRKCKITHAQRKDSVEYFPEWHTHIVTSVALNVYVLCLYVILYIYKENMMSKSLVLNMIYGNLTYQYVIR